MLKLYLFIASVFIATPALTQCMRTQQQIKQEINNTLIQKDNELVRAQEILLAKSQGQNTDLHILGHITYTKNNPQVYDKDNWENKTYSWASIYKKRFLPIKNSSPIENPEAWIELLDSSKDLQYDDDFLEREPQYYGTYHQDEPILASIILKMHQRDYELPTREKNYILKRPWFRKFLLEKNYDQLLATATSLYNHHFHFHKEHTVKRIDAKTLELPLDSGDFDKSELYKFEAIIAKYWSSPKLSLKIKWVNNPLNQMLFYRIMGFSLVGKATVNRADRVINLFSGTSEGVIAHEIGHVLGFSDVYFPIWESSKCRYVVQTNNSDIMSSPTYGSVMQKHWDELDWRYPYSY